MRFRADVGGYGNQDRGRERCDDGRAAACRCARVLHFGLDVYAACAAERRELMVRRTMTPDGYNGSLGGEYAGPRAMFYSARSTSIGYLVRLSESNTWTGPGRVPS